MIGPHLLGRKQEHDERSRAFARTARIVRPRNVSHTLHGPHLNQGDLGSCEGNTAAEWLNCAKALKNRRSFNDVDGARSNRYLDEADAVTLYSAATVADGFPGDYPPSDTGTSGLGIAKAMLQAGALTRYDWTFTWAAFLSALQTQPVMLGTVWYDSMFAPNASGVVTISRRDMNPVGGHAYLAFVLDYRMQRIGCTNHWVNDDGTPWGVRIGGHDGCFWLPFLVAQRLLINEQGESLVPVLL